MNEQKPNLFAMRLKKKKSAKGNEYYTGFFGPFSVYGRIKDGNIDLYFQEAKKKEPTQYGTFGNSGADMSYNEEDAPF